MVNKKTNKDYCRANRQKRGDLYKANDDARKKTERERRKDPEPKKYKVFKKKEAAHVREYRLKKKRCQSSYRSALQRRHQKQHRPHLQHFKQNKFWAEVFTRLKDHSHPVRKRRPRRLEILPKNSIYV